MSAFYELTDAYRDRDRAALEWKAQDGQVVGCLGSDVPEEFLTISVRGKNPMQRCYSTRLFAPCGDFCCNKVDSLASY